jgi:hypothetical protein
VNFREIVPGTGRLRRTLSPLGACSSIWLAVAVLACTCPARPAQQGSNLPAAASAAQPSPGTITGTVVDQTGAAVAGAHVTLAREGPSKIETLSGDSGQFSFSSVAPGPFDLTVTSVGFATQTTSGTLGSGETRIVPPIALIIAAAATQVRVGLTQTEVAQVEIQDEEKQRVLGFIPNFYVSYVPNAAPLGTKQKFGLALRVTVDPVTFVVTAAVAGFEQAGNVYGGYGQGADGYARRYGAAYADYVSSTFLGSAILPSLLKQDPRYFYKGTGSTRSRFLYAVANAVICKSDRGRWETNYSSILGNFAAGGVSNLYYPDKDRGTALVFENGLIGIGATAGANVLQEFLIRKLTPHLPSPDPSKS